MTLNCTEKDTEYFYYVSFQYKDCNFFRHMLSRKKTSTAPKKTINL